MIYTFGLWFLAHAICPLLPWYACALFLALSCLWLGYLQRGSCRKAQKRDRPPSTPMTSSAKICPTDDVLPVAHEHNEEDDAARGQHEEDDLTHGRNQADDHEMHAQNEAYVIEDI